MDGPMVDSTDAYTNAYWGGPRGGWGGGPRMRWGGPWGPFGPRRGGWWWGGGPGWWGRPWGGYWRTYGWRRGRWRAFGCCCPLMLLATLSTCATLLTGSLALVRRTRAR